MRTPIFKSFGTTSYSNWYFHQKRIHWSKSQDEKSTDVPTVSPASCSPRLPVPVTWVSMAPPSVYDWGNLNDVYTCNRGRRACLPRHIVEQWHHSQPQAHTLNQSPVLRNRSRWIIIKFFKLIMIRRINFSFCSFSVFDHCAQFKNIETRVIFYNDCKAWGWFQNGRQWLQLSLDTKRGRAALRE